jgi:tRNA1(Val) A37 N6-methylase TrmN6
MAAYPNLLFTSDRNPADVLLNLAKNVSGSSTLLHPKEFGPIGKYVDMGCGIGSTLLLIAHTLRPSILSVGIEAQTQSSQLVQRTIAELPHNAPHIIALHSDIRRFTTSSNDDAANICTASGTLTTETTPATSEIDDTEVYVNIDDILIGDCDLVTANPPYSPLRSGTLCKDAQRRSARFELRGGVEEFALAANRLLSPRGRFVMAFWHRDVDGRRVERAAEAAGLLIRRRLDVVMGRPLETKPHLSIYDMSLSEGAAGHPCEGSSGLLVTSIDITRDPVTGGLSETYSSVRRLLNMAPRPLKKSRAKSSSTVNEGTERTPAVTHDDDI